MNLRFDVSDMKVFVSSTLTDMMPYRQAACRAIERLGLEPLLLEELWGKIHKKGRQGIIAEEVQNIVASSDIFVLLLGTRSGNIIPGQSISWIELESTAATLAKRPFFLYIIDYYFPEMPKDEREAHAFLNCLSAGTVSRTVTSPAEFKHIFERDIATFIAGQEPEDAPTTVILPHVSPHDYQSLLAYPEELERCSPRFFEELIADLLKADGWAVQLVSRNNAPGPDIIAVSSKLMTDRPVQLIVECKRNRAGRPVDIDVVRKVMYWVNEEYRATFGMIATTSYFTRDAKEQAERLHHWRLDLRDQQRILSWVGRAWAQKPN